MSNRLTQHRPKREEQKSRELADLKRENTKLKRVVKRLRKEVKKVEDTGLLALEEGEVEVEQRVTVASNRCSKCNEGEVTVIELGERHYRVCALCKDRSRVDGTKDDT